MEIPPESPKIRDVELLNFTFPDGDRCVQVRMLVSSLLLEAMCKKGFERL
jgi:hypothetical protein